MNYASSMIKDMVDPELKMFHSNEYPPHLVKMSTCLVPSDIIRISLAKITEYLSKFITPQNFTHHMTNSLLLANGDVLMLDENSMVIQIGYENELLPDRAFTLQLALDSAHVKMH